MSKDQLYAVTVERFGEVMRSAENIRNARRWAWVAFGAGPECVRRIYEYRLCDACDCAPCCCEEVSS